MHCSDWIQAGRGGGWPIDKCFKASFSEFTQPPFPFGGICFVVLVMRKGGEQLKWSLALEVFHVHSYQDQFIQPGWAECVFLYIYPRFVFCVFICVL